MENCVEGAAVTDAARELPVGQVTMLFTDIDSSTWLLQRLGEQYQRLLDQHDAILRRVFAAFGGHEVDTQGDAFFVALASAEGAVSSAF